MSATGNRRPVVGSALQFALLPYCYYWLENYVGRLFVLCGAKFKPSFVEVGKMVKRMKL
jgi:hypothetical protein